MGKIATVLACILAIGAPMPLAAGLSLASVNTFAAPNHQGTVFLIPQIHKNPGSKPSEPINDSAEISQKEIYGIISYLVREVGVDLVVIEGFPYGKITDAKLNRVKEVIEKQGIFSREAIVYGAPLVLKAQGRDFSLYGAENTATLENSVEVLREYLAFKTGVTSKKFQEIILDRRNKEAAENFSRALNAEGKKYGILQFGASHTEGLIEELQKLGLSVIVLTPPQVAKLKRPGDNRAPGVISGAAL